MENILLFLMTFVFVFIAYELLIVNKAKKNHKKKDFKEIMEIRYLITKYNLNMKKVNYNQLVQIVAIVSSLDISIAVTLATLMNSFLMEILVILVSIIVLILLSYHIVYLFYKKKGMIIND